MHFCNCNFSVWRFVSLAILQFCGFVIIAILQFCYFAVLRIAVLQFVLYFVFISIYILLRSMGGNTPKGIYKHNVSYFSAPVNKYSLFCLDLLIQTVNLVMLLYSYAGGRCPSGILTLYLYLYLYFYNCNDKTKCLHSSPSNISFFLNALFAATICGNIQMAQILKRNNTLGTWL